MATAPRRRRRVVEDEHENSERWLVTYADMLTVLMALFIVMFALSVVDQKKFAEFKAGLQNDVGHGPTLLDAGAGLQQQSSDMAMDVAAAAAALDEKRLREQARAQELADLEGARDRIRRELVARHLEDQVRFRIDERGLVVSVVTDDVLFEVGSATLRPAGQAVLDAVAPALVALPNPVTVEGHTDDLPITGGRFPSNWELSTARATTVLRYAVEAHALPAGRVSAAGYADQRPVVPHAPSSRGQNRRVEVIVRSLVVVPDDRPVAPAGVPAAHSPGTAPAPAPAPAPQQPQQHAAAAAGEGH